MELTEEIIKQGLGCMGRHPILRNHYYLELNISVNKFQFPLFIYFRLIFISSIGI